MAGKQTLQIFRAEDAPDIYESGMMDVLPGTPVQNAGLQRMFEAGLDDGSDLRVLVNIPGFSLFHIWFKAGYPLPLHSHDSDCLYFIIAGSLRLGTEELGPRDSFFVPENSTYTYEVGSDGLELLEIRHTNHSIFQNHAKNQKFFDEAVAAITANKDAWREARRPALNA